MAINITMPALSPTMEEGTLAKWNVKPGDTVEAGDVIAEIETDKATMEVEAVDEGTVAQILVDEGTEGVKVNAIIAVRPKHRRLCQRPRTKRKKLRPRLRLRSKSRRHLFKCRSLAPAMTVLKRARSPAGSPR